MSKYSQRLKFEDTNNSKWLRSALGKKIPGEEDRRKRLAELSYFNKLYKMLKYTDWSRSPVYH